MANRRSSGLFETVVKSVFGFGTTVHYRKTWLGQTQKIVKHHDSGKQKTYTHGCGFFGNVTKTKREQNGQVYEEGRLKKNLLWGATEQAQRTDGSIVERKYTPGFFRDHVRTHISGPCWKCAGRGAITIDCRACGGSGVFHRDAKPCFDCKSTGRRTGLVCRRCAGSGYFKPALDEPCRRCNGSRSRSVTCKKCGGSGRYCRTKIT